MFKSAASKSKAGSTATAKSKAGSTATAKSKAGSTATAKSKAGSTATAKSKAGSTAAISRLGSAATGSSQGSTATGAKATSKVGGVARTTAASSAAAKTTATAKVAPRSTTATATSKTGASAKVAPKSTATRAPSSATASTTTTVRGTLPKTTPSLPKTKAAAKKAAAKEQSRRPSESTQTSEKTVFSQAASTHTLVKSASPKVAGLHSPVRAEASVRTNASLDTTPKISENELELPTQNIINSARETQNDSEAEKELGIPKAILKESEDRQTVFSSILKETEDRQTLSPANLDGSPRAVKKTATVNFDESPIVVEDSFEEPSKEQFKIKLNECTIQPEMNESQVIDQSPNSNGFSTGYSELPPLMDPAQIKPEVKTSPKGSTLSSDQPSGESENFLFRGGQPDSPMSSSKMVDFSAKQSLKSSKSGSLSKSGSDSPGASPISKSTYGTGDGSGRSAFKSRKSVAVDKSVDALMQRIAKMHNLATEILDLRDEVSSPRTTAKESKKEKKSLNVGQSPNSGPRGSSRKESMYPDDQSEYTSEDYDDGNSNSIDYSVGSDATEEDADLVEKEEKLAKKVARAFARLGLKEVKEDGDAPSRLVQMGEEEEFDFGDSYTEASEEDHEELTPGGRRLQSTHWKHALKNLQVRQSEEDKMIDEYQEIQDRTDHDQAVMLGTLKQQNHQLLNYEDELHSEKLKRMEIENDLLETKRSMQEIQEQEKELRERLERKEQVLEEQLRDKEFEMEQAKKVLEIQKDSEVRDAQRRFEEEMDKAMAEHEEKLKIELREQARMEFENLGAGKDECAITELADSEVERRFLERRSVLRQELEAQVANSVFMDLDSNLRKKMETLGLAAFQRKGKIHDPFRPSTTSRTISTWLDKYSDTCGLENRISRRNSFIENLREVPAQPYHGLEDRAIIHQKLNQWKYEYHDLCELPVV